MPQDRADYPHLARPTRPSSAANTHGGGGGVPSANTLSPPSTNGTSAAHASNSRIISYGASYGASPSARREGLHAHGHGHGHSHSHSHSIHTVNSHSHSRAGSRSSASSMDVDEMIIKASTGDEGAGGHLGGSALHPRPPPPLQRTQRKMAQAGSSMRGGASAMGRVPVRMGGVWGAGGVWECECAAAGRDARSWPAGRRWRWWWWWCAPAAGGVYDACIRACCDGCADEEDQVPEFARWVFCFLTRPSSLPSSSLNLYSFLSLSKKTGISPAASLDALPASTAAAALAPAVPFAATNSAGQRICRQCGMVGRYKDGKCVEKWGPGPMGPGTVCDR